MFASMTIIKALLVIASTTIVAMGAPQKRFGGPLADQFWEEHPSTEDVKSGDSSWIEASICSILERNRAEIEGHIKFDGDWRAIREASCTVFELDQHNVFTYTTGWTEDLKSNWWVHTVRNAIWKQSDAVPGGWATENFLLIDSETHAKADTGLWKITGRESKLETENLGFDTLRDLFLKAENTPMVIKSKKDGLKKLSKSRFYGIKKMVQNDIYCEVTLFDPKGGKGHTLTYDLQWFQSDVAEVGYLL
ncbi:uncharacterized protein IL334_000104 [Kwoniella shivajii]|uniref:Uncharacterized protein n=1 Tax=Kwoniella shivajii TaxID=564305 RepID=A0ABZ1CR94_9TREE|nr:hypothetical protein IL334_000104 [Kwoniella shivajii]